MTSEIEELPDSILVQTNEPFGGLFTSRLKSTLIEELISDPYHVYRPKELAELLDTTYPTLRTHFSDLIQSGLIIKDDRDQARPKYKVNFDSRRLVALSLLMDAINDDRDGTESMYQSIIRYCKNQLEKDLGLFQGTVNLYNIQADSIEKFNVNVKGEEYQINGVDGRA